MQNNTVGTVYVLSVTFKNILVFFLHYEKKQMVYDNFE